MLEESYFNVPVTVASYSPGRSPGRRKRHPRESPVSKLPTSKQHDLICKLMIYLENNRENARTLEDLCPSCLGVVSSICEKNYQEYQRLIRAYTIGIQSLTQQQFSNDPASLLITKFQRSSSDDTNAYYASIDSAEMEAERLQAQYSEYKEQLVCVTNERATVEAQLQSLMSAINSLEQDIENVNNDLNLSLSLVDSSSRENELFDHSNYLISRPLYDIFDDGTVFAINGLRLKYLPTPILNLNWAEINSAWCCVALCLQSIRYRHNLSEHVDLVRHQGNSGGEYAGMRLQLRPLRRTVLIIESVFQVSNESEGGNGGRDEGGSIFKLKSGKENEIEEIVHSLCGSPDASVLQDYRHAIVHLAVIFVVTLSQLQCLPLIEENSSLHTLYDTVCRNGIDANSATTSSSSLDDCWGYGEEDLDYYDIDANECNTGVFSTTGDKVEKLVQDLLTTMVVMARTPGLY